MFNVLKVLEVINLKEKLLYLYFCAQRLIPPALQFYIILVPKIASMKLD